MTLLKMYIGQRCKSADCGSTRLETSAQSTVCSTEEPQETST